MANMQAALSISTLLYLALVPLAATHQAGSVALLSAVSRTSEFGVRSGGKVKYWLLSRASNPCKEIQHCQNLSLLVGEEVSIEDSKLAEGEGGEPVVLDSKLAAGDGNSAPDNELAAEMEKSEALDSALSGRLGGIIDASGYWYRPR
ncbi:hypothetical protein EDB87DRAFT_1582064 [Lactarius vividus]|nr:hypothetical protein EDB87DRAFT_1582064 [Lactarius vividus]